MGRLKEFNAGSLKNPLPLLPQAIPVGTPDYAMAVLWGAILLITIFLVPVQKSHKRVLALLWGIRLLAALGMMPIIEAYYEPNGVDAFGYYYSALSGDFDLTDIAMGSGTQIITFLTWLHIHVVPDSYHAAKVSFAFVGLWATYLFYLSAREYLGRESFRLHLCLGGFPSLIYWSSILGKDPIVLLGIGLHCWGVMRWWKSGGSKHLWTALAGILLAMSIRFWMGPILLFPALCIVSLPSRGTIVRLLLPVVAVGCVMTATYALADRIGVSSVQEIAATASQVSDAFSEGGSSRASSGYTDLSTMLQFLPIGLFSALFRPLPGEVPSLLGTMAGVENLVLLGLALMALLRLRLAPLKEPLVQWAILIIVSWGMLYGFVSHFNMGTGVRYRLQVLPILLAVLLRLSTRSLDTLAASVSRKSIAQLTAAPSGQTHFDVLTPPPVPPPLEDQA